MSSSVMIARVMCRAVRREFHGTTFRKGDVFTVPAGDPKLKDLLKDKASWSVKWGQAPVHVQTQATASDIQEAHNAFRDLVEQTKRFAARIVALPRSVQVQLIEMGESYGQEMDEARAPVSAILESVLEERWEQGRLGRAQERADQEAPPPAEEAQDNDAEEASEPAEPSALPPPPPEVAPATPQILPPSPDELGDDTSRPGQLPASDADADRAVAVKKLLGELRKGEKTRYSREQLIALAVAAGVVAEGANDLAGLTKPDLIIHLRATNS